MKLQIGYLDDNVQAIEIFKWAVQNQFSIESVCYYSNLAKLNSELKKGRHFDLFFLDIEMPGSSGFEVASILSHYKIPYVFLTNHADFALRAFDVNAVDYLLKPVTNASIMRSIEKLNNRFEFIRKNSLVGNEEIKFNKPNLINANKIVVKVSNESYNIDLDTIVCITKVDSYSSEIYFKDNTKLLSSNPIRKFEEMFFKKSIEIMFRSSLNDIINLNEIKSMKVSGKNYQITLSNGMIIELPVYRGVLLKKHLKHLSA